jgi:hypothetical protein
MIPRGNWRNEKMGAHEVKDAESTAIAEGRRRTTWKHWAAYLILIAFMVYYNRGKLTGGVIGGVIDIIAIATLPLFVFAGIWYSICRIRKRPFSWAGVLVTFTVFFGVVYALNVIVDLIPDPAKYVTTNPDQDSDARQFYAELNDAKGDPNLIPQVIAKSQTKSANLFRTMEIASDEANNKIGVILSEMQADEFPQVMSPLKTMVDGATIEESRRFVAQHITASHSWMPRINAVYAEERDKVNAVASDMSGTEAKRMLEGFENSAKVGKDYYQGKINDYDGMLSELDAELSIIESPDNKFHFVSGKPSLGNNDAINEFNSHAAKLREFATADQQLEKRFVDYQASVKGNWLDSLK